MISKARIVIGETSSGELRTLHASFDAVAALGVFKSVQQDQNYVEVGLIEHGIVKRISRPAKQAVDAIPPAAQTEPPPIVPVSESTPAPHKQKKK